MKGGFAEADSLFFRNLNGVDQSIILPRSKCKVEFALSRGRDIVKNLHDGPVSHSTGFFEDVEIFQQSRAVAIDIKNAAAHAAKRLG